jgi:hypothetical protein
VPAPSGLTRIASDSNELLYQPSGCAEGCVDVTPAGRSSLTVSRRSHSAFSSPRILEQSGLLAVVPTPRAAGGTTDLSRVCDSTAEFGGVGIVACWG